MRADQLPKFQGSDKANVYYGPGGHIVHYPTGRDDYINFVAIESKSSWHEESWRTEGESRDLLSKFANWNEGLVHMMASANKVYKWESFKDPPTKAIHGEISFIGRCCSSNGTFFGPRSMHGYRRRLRFG